jgi:hypothetical protein
MGAKIGQEMQFYKWLGLDREGGIEDFGMVQESEWLVKCILQERMINS